MEPTQGRASAPSGAGSPARPPQGSVTPSAARRLKERGQGWKERGWELVSLSWFSDLSQNTQKLREGGPQGQGERTGRMRGRRAQETRVLPSRPGTGLRRIPSTFRSPGHFCLPAPGPGEASLNRGGAEASWTSVPPGLVAQKGGSLPSSAETLGSAERQREAQVREGGRKEEAGPGLRWGSRLRQDVLWGQDPPLPAPRAARLNRIRVTTLRLPEASPSLAVPKPVHSPGPPPPAVIWLALPPFSP